MNFCAKKTSENSEVFLCTSILILFLISLDEVTEWLICDPHDNTDNYDDSTCDTESCYETELSKPVVKWTVSFTREEDDEWPYTKKCSKEFLWSILVDE